MARETEGEGRRGKEMGESGDGDWLSLSLSLYTHSTLTRKG